MSKGPTNNGVTISTIFHGKAKVINSTNAEITLKDNVLLTLSSIRFFSKIMTSSKNTLLIFILQLESSLVSKINLSHVKENYHAKQFGCLV